MSKEYQKYTFEQLLDDPDFCGWARSERPDLDDHFREFLDQYPEQKAAFQKACRLVRILDDEKVKTDPSRKLQIWDQINRKSIQIRPARNYRLLFRYAAVFLLLGTIGSVTYYIISSKTANEFLSSYNLNDFNEAKLLLDNGKEINIQTDRSEIVYEKSGGQVKVNNQLVYQGEEQNQEGMNQLIVPFGKQSKITLSDRTEVWLNAGSRLVYPAVFKGNKRKIYLQGEAFLKVSKDKSKPFFVETNNSLIKVLGTSFNVKAYPDEKVEETVLVEGAVSLNPGKAMLGEEVRLKPDQRVVVQGSDHSYSVSKVDVRNYTSWIDGLFVFNEEPLPSVLMRISRFYKLEIKWMNNVENRRISGKLDLKDDYQRVLNTLAIISDGAYSEKDNTIYFTLK